MGEKQRERREKREGLLHVELTAVLSNIKAEHLGMHGWEEKSMVVRATAFLLSSSFLEKMATCNTLVFPLPKVLFPI